MHHLNIKIKWVEMFNNCNQTLSTTLVIALIVILTDMYQKYRIINEIQTKTFI